MYDPSSLGRLWMLWESMITQETLAINAIFKCHFNLIIQLKSWWLQGILLDILLLLFPMLKMHVLLT